MQNSIRRLLLFAACAFSAAALTGCSVSDLGLTGEPAQSLPLADPMISSASEDGAPSSTVSSTSTEAVESAAAAGSTTRSEEDLEAAVATPGSTLRLSTDPEAVYLAGTCHRSPEPESEPQPEPEPQPRADAELEPVPCTEPHSVEVYAVRRLPGGPGATFLGLDAAIALCNEDFFRATGIGLGLATILERSVLRPGQESWAGGERDVTCYVVYPTPTDQPLTAIDPTRGFGRVSIYGLEAGDCLADFDQSATSFSLVGCDQPHDGEVFAARRLEPGDFPGDEELERLADELCYGQGFQDFVGTAYQDSSVVSLASRPTVQTWSLGHRTISCILTDELVRTRSLAGSGL